MQVGGYALVEDCEGFFWEGREAAAANFSVHNGRSLDLSYSILVQKFALWE